MNEELKYMEYRVWDLVQLSESSKIIECRWVFKTKRDSNDNIERYKAKLVAKRNTKKKALIIKRPFHRSQRKTH